MKIVVCPNAFKGSMTALEAVEAISDGLRAALGPGAELVGCPLADGGDGTLETLVAATGGTMHAASVHDPLGRPIRARWGRLGGDRSSTAVIEMAEASGLGLLSADERDPLRASTFGTGELVAAALDAACTHLIIGIGGSATNDGGAGLAAALGGRLLDESGAQLPPGGAALARLARIDIARMRPLAGVTIEVACDVDNPLCGPEGAAAMFGPQKGATPQDVRILDAALGHYAGVLARDLGRSVDRVPGAGAAGGLGAGLMAFCAARPRPGAEIVMDAQDFRGCLRGAALAVTGEGKIDRQTVRGKAIAAASKVARSAGVPVIALVGSIEDGAEAMLRPLGLTAAFSIVDGPCDLEACMKRGPEMLRQAAERIGRLAACLMS